jgi:hypothetical protein
MVQAPFQRFTTRLPTRSVRARIGSDPEVHWVVVAAD